jgi:hypothetical protein
MEGYKHKSAEEKEVSKYGIKLQKGTKSAHPEILSSFDKVMQEMLKWYHEICLVALFHISYKPP